MTATRTQARNEHTIARTCKISGQGYWTGQHVRVEIHPAEPGTGVVLVRSDLPDQPSCEALAFNRHDTHLRTIIESGAARFEMVEHLMAALYALEIDNCRVEINGLEFPGLDGSSKAYVDAIESVGLVTQESTRDQLIIDQCVRIEAGNRWIQLDPISEETGRSQFSYRLEFDDESLISSQDFRFRCCPNSFAREVAPARTFVTQSQAQSLRAQGVARHVSNRDLLVFGDDGPVENELRFPNECARHKTLDLVGDLALVGVDIIGSVHSHRGGHSLNGMMAERLIQLTKHSSATPERLQRDPSNSRAA